MPIDPRPRNRLAQELPVLSIEIQHAQGTTVLDPNSSIMMAVVTPGEVLELAALPNTKSILSGEPAVLYRSGNIEVPVTPPELLRLMTTSLEPKEFFKLMEVYGTAFEWHDDFYDFDSGEALQPRIPASAAGYRH
ncbi:hypothetical protein [Bosea sp. RAC05]|uniref:hypothetical protein n=1 Tax=Bosea sp. RAC05 TaxID=1842539 RepID=UPI00083CA9ED|nr:hypothetical protein [Bosea sp. RAC05]AOG03037.1 hypothetical protein BSY19_5047 [Bosea sp. RAC05]